MTNITERFYDDEGSYNHSVASNISYLLSNAIEQRGKATFMVSGGSTPKTLYRSLSKEDLYWQQIQVAMVDECWVSTEDENSSEQFIRSNLLQNKAKAAKFQGMKTSAKFASEAVTELNQAYENLNAPFDVTVLGMGNDGHTASLFPHSNALEDTSRHANNLCQSVQIHNSEQTTEITEGMSLTMNALMQSKVIFLLLRGKAKLATYRKAMSGTDIFEMPIRAILKQTKIPVIVNWAP